MSASVAEKLRQKSTEIMITVDQKQTVDEAEAALIKLGGVYVKARVLVQVVHDVSESHGLVYPTGTPVIARLGRERLREQLGAAATWLRKGKGKGGKSETVEVHTPPWVAATLEQRGEWKLPWLDRVSDVPVLRSDGSLHDKPGYDAATRTIYDPGTTKYPAIPPHPTPADARRAYAELVEPMCDVPFVADSDRAAWVALALTLIARSAIDGCTPMFLVRAPTPGSGKGLNVDVAAIIGTGRIAPKRPPVANDEELRKALFAAALEAPALVTIDNQEGALGSPVLAMVLTAGVVTDRLLGVSENRTIPARFVIAATGNNIQLRGDTGRRVVPIDIDPGVEHPEDRRDFRYPDLIAHVRAERPRLVAAALTLLRAYFAAGSPSHGKPAKGSYEAWDRVVRGAVYWASGHHDPLGGVERIREEGDEDLERLRALLDSWHGAFGSLPTTVAEAIEKAGDSGDLHDALAAYSKSGKPDARRTGIVLRGLRGRICGGKRFERAAERAHGGVYPWSVVQVDGGYGGNGGHRYATRDEESDDSQSVGAGECPPTPPSPPWEPYEEVEDA